MPRMYSLASAMERRRGVRYEIQLSCRLKRHRNYEVLDAMTLNLGRSGALVVTGSSDYTDSKLLPQRGDPLQLEVVLPAHRNFGQRCLACDAVVVRTAAADGRCLVALQFERMEMRNVLSQSVAASRLEVM
jgi:hypothetical protein